MQRMNWLLPLTVALTTPAQVAPAPAPTAPPAAFAPTVNPALTPSSTWSAPAADWAPAEPCPRRSPFQSDDAFPRFIGPVSNPVLSKDPRSLTELRALYVHNWFPADNPVGGGELYAFAAQARVALTDRLSFIADKDGYAFFRPRNRTDFAQGEGFLNVAAGLKYALVRDVEHQFLLTVGAMFEPQSGAGKVFQSHGDGLVSVFATAGKEVACYNHVLLTVGYVNAIDRTDNGAFGYASLHLDRQVFGFLYPLVEVNYFHYTAGGDRGIPAALGEGDGLINFGTDSMGGANFCTVAGGLKVRVSSHVEAGAVWETPVSNRKDLLRDRLTVELILRY
jgi:hypothetical protein